MNNTTKVFLQSLLKSTLAITASTVLIRVGTAVYDKMTTPATAKDR